MSYDKFLKICKDPCWQYFLNLEKKQSVVCKSNKVVNDEGQKFSERMINPNYEVYLEDPGDDQQMQKSVD